ncbi:MAG: hypothetical protein Q8867_04055 [Bacteroidota bacterium]|nr:hypothetical protein [Bacteroidota bacterium]
MNKKPTSTTNEKPLLDKAQVLQNVKSLITNKSSKLNTKFLESFDKVAIFIKDHMVEIEGEPNKRIKYMSIDIPLSSSEHKEIMNCFMDEMKKRNEQDSMKKLNELRGLIKS